MELTSSPETAARTVPGAPRWATVAAWLLGVFFAGLGALRLLPMATDQWLFEAWGVPWWLRTGAALAELLAGALLVIRRTRVLGAVGIFTVMASAGTMHAALGHSMVIAALVNGVPALLAAAVAWAHRRQLAEL